MALAAISVTASTIASRLHVGVFAGPNRVVQVMPAGLVADPAGVVGDDVATSG